MSTLTADNTNGLEKKMILKNQTTNKFYSVKNNELWELNDGSVNTINAYGTSVNETIVLNKPMDTVVKTSEISTPLSTGKVFEFNVNKDKLNYLQFKNTTNTVDKYLLYSNGKYYGYLPETISTISAIPAYGSVTPYPYVIEASSSYDEAHNMYKAFDKILPTDGSNAWGTVFASAQPSWIGVDFLQSKTIGKYSIYPANGMYDFDPNYASPKNFEFQGSNDNFASYEVLDTQSDVSDWTAQYKEFTIAEPKAFKQYRLYVTEIVVQGSGVLAIGELDMFEANSGVQVVMDNDTVSNYTIYGLSDEVMLNLNKEMTLKIDTSVNIAQTETAPITFNEILNSNFTVKNFIEGTETSSTISLIMDEFNSYDYVSDYPSVMVYSESDTDDVKIMSDVDKTYAYDLLYQGTDILYYTDADSQSEEEVRIQADYSPLDDLVGNFEVVTLSKDYQSIALTTSGVQSPKFVTFENVISIGQLGSIKSVLEGNVYTANVRVGFSNNNQNWYKWTGNNFEQFNASTTDLILANGNTLEEINSITTQQWDEKWNFATMSVGVLFEDDRQNETVSKIRDILISQVIPVNSSKINNVSLYILNTTASINLNFQNNVLTGQVSDEDLTRVQYRVILNNAPYYPMSGEFTALSSPPVNIDLTFNSNDLKINDFNTLVVEFKDYFGTVDTWEVEFIGKYSGLIFRTTDGEYYSSDVGAVLKYLDFGTLIAGKTSTEHTVILKNEFGYTVKDVLLAINESVLPQGLKVEFQKPGTPQWSNNLALADEMIVNQEEAFNIRLVSQLSATPRPNGEFDIYVSAIK